MTEVTPTNPGCPPAPQSAPLPVHVTWDVACRVTYACCFVSNWNELRVPRTETAPGLFPLKVVRQAGGSTWTEARVATCLLHRAGMCSQGPAPSPDSPTAHPLLNRVGIGPGSCRGHMGEKVGTRTLEHRKLVPMTLASGLSEGSRPRE